MKPMEHYTGQYDTLVQVLFITEQKEKNIITRTEKCLLTCRNYLLSLQTDVNSERFAQIAEEIQFFKEIWPKFYSFFLYYQKVYAIEINRPVGYMLHEENYLNKELDHLKDFFEEHRFIYQYYRTGDTYLDEKLFTTISTKNQVATFTFDPNTENGFPTVYSDLFARIIAHDRLQTYLQQEVSKLQTSKYPEAPAPTISTSFHWTGAKVCLAELIYAFSEQSIANSFADNCEKYKLTTRESEIAKQIDKGYPHKEIAAILFISERTVGKHVQNIFEKLNVSNKIEMINKLKGV
jgi:DNA-binding CsgD family transcriptional regulator